MRTLLPLARNAFPDWSFSIGRASVTCVVTTFDDAPPTGSNWKPIRLLFSRTVLTAQIEFKQLEWLSSVLRKVPNGMRASLKKETMPPTFFPSLNFTRIYFDLLCVSTAWWRRETHYTFASVKGFVPRTSSSFYESNWRIGILNSIIDYNHLPSEGKRRQLVWVAPIQQDLIHFKCIVTVKEEAHNKNKKLDMKRGSIFHNVNPFIWIYSKKWNIKSHHQKPLLHGYLQTYCYRRANTRDAHSFHVTGLRVIYIIWDCRVIAFVCLCDGTLSTKTPGNTCHLARPVPHSSPLLSYAFHLLSSGEEMDSLPIRELRPRGTCQIALDCSSD